MADRIYNDAMKRVVAATTVTLSVGCYGPSFSVLFHVVLPVSDGDDANLARSQEVRSREGGIRSS